MTQPSIDGTGHGIPRMLYASDGSNWYAILVDSDGHVKIDVVSAALPTDAATQTTLASCLTALQLIDDLRAALGTVATDKILVASKSGDKIFGFESVLNAFDSTTFAGGVFTALSTAVPAGKVWVITVVAVRPNSRAATYFIGGISKNGTLVYTLYDPDGIGQYFISTFPVTFYLDAGDKLFFDVGGAQNGDEVQISYSGYQMNAP